MTPGDTQGVPGKNGSVIVFPGKRDRVTLLPERENASEETDDEKKDIPMTSVQNALPAKDFIPNTPETHQCRLFEGEFDLP